MFTRERGGGGAIVVVFLRFWLTGGKGREKIGEEDFKFW